MSKILITGGAGFIGTHLADRLSQTKSNKIVLFDSFRRDSLKYASHLANHPQIEVVNGDVLNAELVAAAMEGVDTVIHLAAIAGVSSYYSEPLNTLRINIIGTTNVLEQASKAGVKSFIYFSTSEIYGPNALWVDEKTPCAIGSSSELRWVYATSKLAGENFCLRSAEKHGFSCTVIRPFNIYGPGQVGEGAISNFCRAVADGKPLIIHGDGSAIRAWCYISDLVDAVIAVMDRPSTSCRTFNIGNPREVETTLGLARRIVNLSKNTELEFHEGVASEVRGRIPVIEAARQSLSFEPKVDLDEGLKHTIAWFSKHAKS